MSGERFRYSAYGLVFDSDFALEEAEPCPTGIADVRIRHATLVGPEEQADFRDYSISADGDLLSFANVGRFLIAAGGAEILIDPAPGFDLRLIGLPLLGPVLALLLHRRGQFVLHGSAVLIGGQAEVFLGDKGAGKSTSAAALVAAGYPLIADDAVAVVMDPALGPIIHPGYQAMKLDEALFARFAPGSAHVLEPRDGLYTAGKLRVRLGRDNPVGPIVLGRIHCLGRGAANALASLSGAAALQALIRFSHYPRLGQAALAPAETASLFRLAAALVPSLRIGQLTVKNSLSEIGSLAAFLERESGFANVPG